MTYVHPMRITFLLLLIVFFFDTQDGTAQSQAPWRGKQCAVVLTYDDALNVHLDKAIPVLDSLSLKATFYLSGFFPGFRQRVDDWKAIAVRGHELANHTLFHPCTGNTPGREWVKPDYDLSKYTPARITDEIRMTNVLLQALDGKTQRTFAYPCGDTQIGGVPYFAQVAEDFVAARGVHTEFLPIGQINLANVGSVVVNGQSGEQLIALVQKAMETHSLLVFLFHGVGGEHNLDVSLPAHRQLLAFLHGHQRQIWVAPFLEVTRHVKDYQGGTKAAKPASPR
jgi:sialate O-acetylesterase